MAIQRGIKLGNVRSFDESYQLGHKPARADEVDTDFDVIYDAFNIVCVDIPAFTLADAGFGLAVTPAGTGLHWIAGGFSGVPSGPAGGDLAGTYPNPTVIDDSHNHTAATLPPTIVYDGDAAGGDLAGVFPNPSVVDDSHNHTAGTLPGSIVYDGDAAGGDLAGSTYPNPVIAANAVTNTKIANDAVTTAKILDSSVTHAKMGNKGDTAGNIVPNLLIGNVETTVWTIATTSHGGRFLVLQATALTWLQSAASTTLTWRWKVNGVTVAVIVYNPIQGGGQSEPVVPPNLAHNTVAGAVTFELTAQLGVGGGSISSPAGNQGAFYVTEIL